MVCCFFCVIIQPKDIAGVDSYSPCALVAVGILYIVNDGGDMGTLAVGQAADFDIFSMIQSEHAVR